MTDEQLRKSLEKYGEINLAIVCRYEESSHSKGSGFVHFKTKEQADFCIEAFNQVFFSSLLLRRLLFFCLLILILINFIFFFCLEKILFFFRFLWVPAFPLFLGKWNNDWRSKSLLLPRFI